MVISRKAGLLATVAVAGVLLVGCDSGPGQAGSAAIVGGNAISLDAVQQELNGELANQPAPADGSTPQSPADEARSILTEDVRNQIADAAIGKYGLVVPAQAVSTYLTQNGGLDKLVSSSGLSAGNIQDIAHSNVAMLAYAERYLLKLHVDLDLALVNDQKTATATAAKLAADPADVKSILQSAAGPSGQVYLGQQITGGNIVQNEVQYEQQQQQGDDGSSSQGGSLLPLFAAQSNSAIAFQYSSQQWMVALVQHADGSTTASADDTTALGQLQPEVVAQGALEMLSPLGQQLGIRISPRYGIWDPVGMQVVATADQAATTEIMERGTQR